MGGDNLFTQDSPNNLGREGSKAHLKGDVKRGMISPVRSPLQCFSNYRPGASLKKESSLYKMLQRKSAPDPESPLCCLTEMLLYFSSSLRREMTLHFPSLMNPQPSISEPLISSVRLSSLPVQPVSEASEP